MNDIVVFVQEAAAVCIKFLKFLAWLGTMPGGIFVVEFLSFIVFGTLFLFLVQRHQHLRLSLADALRRLFPTNIYRHASSRTDYWILPVTVVTKALGITALVVIAADTVRGWLVDIFGNPPLIMPEGPASMVLQGLIIFAAGDFAFFFQHYLHHKVPFLWRIHRVHHSAEVLTPITGLVRMHPLENLFAGLLTGIGSGIVGGSVLYLCGMKVGPGALSVVAALTLLGSLLHPFRHSHLWISFGPLSYILSSPCMHQIHHSILPQHRDKNLGVMFSCWDMMFGTLYVPKTRENFPLGISADEIGETNPHLKIMPTLMEPLTSAVRTVPGMTHR